MLDVVLSDDAAPAETKIATSFPGVGAAPMLDGSVRAAVTRIVTEHDPQESINTVLWDNESGRLDFYVYQPSLAIEESIAVTLPKSQKWAIKPSQRPRSEVESAVERLAREPKLINDSLEFVSGSPSPDGAALRIGVLAQPERLESLKASLPTVVDGIPIEIVAADRPVASARVRTTAPVLSGGVTAHPTSGVRCTSGFPVARRQDGQPNHLTADHCDAGAGVSWKWGAPYSSVSIGASSGQAAGDTDLELFVNTQAPSAYMFVGPFNDQTLVSPIRGYFAPIGGDSVCYNGARSGPVCGNVLESADVFSCVAFLQCYWVRWSQQATGIPSSGNGDSGGPVMSFGVRSSDNSVGAYGVGVISMFANPTTTCTGEPADPPNRVCSANNAFAPLVRWAQAQSTHGLVVTSQ